MWLKSIFSILFISCSFFTIATPISCLDIGSGNGSTDLSCVINGGDTFTWRVADPSNLSAETSYSHTIGNSGNDKIEDVGSVLAFLFDVGISIGSSEINDHQYFTLFDNHTNESNLSFLGKYDPNSVSDSNYGFLTDSGGLKSGTFLIPELASISTVKAANSFVLNIFNTPQSQGDWSTAGIINNGGKQPALSHISYWAFDDFAEIPEPASFMLFLSGLLCFFIWRRRPVLTKTEN